MPTHLDYLAVRQEQQELAVRAERVRMEREGVVPGTDSRERRFARRLFARLRLRRPAEAPASTR